MGLEQTRADNLHEAIEKDLVARDRARATPSGADDRCLDAARWLRSSAPHGHGEPRPSFVLALEEQLRADLSLVIRARPARLPVRGWLAAAVVVGAVLLGMWGVGRSMPGDPLYGLRQAVEVAQARMSTSSRASASGLLALGQRRIEDLAWAVQHRPTAATDVAADAVGAYQMALSAALSSRDVEVLAATMSAARRAANDLRRLAQSAGDAAQSSAASLVTGADTLDRAVALLPRRMATPPSAGTADAPRGPTQDQVVSAGVVTADWSTATEPAPTRGAAAPTGQITAVAGAADPGPSASPGLVPTEVPPPTRGRTPAKATVVPPTVVQPTSPGSPGAGGTPSAGPATNTPDRWAATSTLAAPYPLDPTPVPTRSDYGTVAPVDPHPTAPPAPPTPEGLAGP